MPPSRFLAWIPLLAFTALLGACHVVGNEALLQQNAAEAEFAKTFLAKLRERDIAYVKQHVAAEFKPAVDDVFIENIAGYLPQGKVLSTEALNVVPGRPADAWKVNFNFEYHYEDGWALEQIAVQQVGDDMYATGVHALRTSASQRELNALTLNGKSEFQYVVLALATVVVAFTFVTFVFCMHTPIRKRKWLWAIWVLCGVCGFRVNWTTGMCSLVFDINFPGASAATFGVYAPWIVSVYFPLGAVMFWMRRSTWIRKAATAEAE